MESAINERIRSLYELSKCKSIRSYANKINVPSTTLNECIKGSEPRYTLIKSILDGEPSLSSEWLLTGKGEMFKKDYNPEANINTASGNIGGINQAGSNSVNIISPTNGTQKIIHPDRTIEIETIGHQEDLSSLKVENTSLKMRISELENIIKRQNRVIDKLTL